MKISVLSVEDQIGSEVHEVIRRQLESWLFVRRGLVEFLNPEREDLRWVTNLADWRRSVEELAGQSDLVFCTVDLSIPRDAESRHPDPSHGLSIVHEITAREQDGLRCCVLTGLDSSAIEKLVGDSAPQVLFDFKASRGNQYRSIVNDIKSQALAAMQSLRFRDSDGSVRELFLEEASNRLRDHYLSRAPYYGDRATWHVPTLVLGAPGLGRKTFAEFVAFVAEAELLTIDLDLPSHTANRRAFEQLEALAREIEGGGAPRVGRCLVFLPNLDRYEPGVSGDAVENCLIPIREILASIRRFDDATRHSCPYGFMFTVAGDSRLRIRSAQTRATIDDLEDAIGGTTDFPLHHLASDANGWPTDHPRIVKLPTLEERGREFLQTFVAKKLESLHDDLEDRVPLFRSRALKLTDEVEDLFIDKMNWPLHGCLGGIEGALDEACANFEASRSGEQHRMTRAHLGESLRQRLARTVLNVDDVSLEFPTSTGESLRVVERIDCHVEDGELLAIVGPSGCGKSSVLRLLAGLLSPTSGTVSYRGERILGPSRKIGFIFQDYSLFPWLTVRENVEFGPRTRGEDPAATALRVEKLLEVAQLDGFDSAWPRQLSGGMQQRVAIVRALANEPDVLLMDEPFGALDVQTRWRMQDFLIRTKKLTKKTVVFVTHDIDEAVYIADRIYVASPRPMTIRDEFIVPFASADHQVGLRTDPVFVALVNRVRDALLGEIRQRSQRIGQRA